MSIGNRMCEEGVRTISELTGETCMGDLKREEKISIKEYLEEINEDDVCAAVSSKDPEKNGFFMLLIPDESRRDFSEKIAGKYDIEGEEINDISDDLLQELANILSSRMCVLLQDSNGRVIHQPPLGSIEALKSFRDVLSKMLSEGMEEINLIDMDFILPEKNLSVHVLYRKDEEKDSYAFEVKR